MSGKQGFAEDYIPVNERIAQFIAKRPSAHARRMLVWHRKADLMEVLT